MMASALRPTGDSFQGAAVVAEDPIPPDDRTMYLEIISEVCTLLDDALATNEPLSQDHCQEVEAKLVPINQQAYFWMDHKKLTAREYNQGCMTVLLTRLFAETKPKTVLSLIRQALASNKNAHESDAMERSGNHVSSMLSLVLDLDSVKLEDDLPSLLGLISTVKSKLTTIKLHKHRKNGRLTTNDYSSQSTQQQIATRSQLPEKVALSTLESLWVVPLSYLVATVVMCTSSTQPHAGSAMQEHDKNLIWKRDLQPKILQILQASFPQLRAVDFVEAGMALRLLDFLQFPTEHINAANIISTKIVAEVVIKDTILKNLQYATDLPRYSLLARCSEAFLARLDIDDDEDIIIATKQIMNKEVPSQYVRQLDVALCSPTNENQLAIKNATTTWTSTAGIEDKTRAVPPGAESSYRDHLLWSAYPLQTHMETYLVANNIEDAIILASRMELCNFFAESDKCKAWTQVFMWLYQQGSVFLDGPVHTVSYKKKRKLILFQLLPRTQALGFAVLLDGYRSIITSSTDATTTRMSLAERVFIQRACHQTVLRLYHAKYNETEGTEAFHFEWLTDLQTSCPSVLAKWPKMTLSTLPEERLDLANALLNEPNDIPMSLRVDGSCYPDLMALSRTPTTQPQPLPLHHLATTGAEESPQQKAESSPQQKAESSPQEKSIVARLESPEKPAVKFNVESPQKQPVLESSPSPKKLAALGDLEIRSNPNHHAMAQPFQGNQENVEDVPREQLEEAQAETIEIDDDTEDEENREEELQDDQEEELQEEAKAHAEEEEANQMEVEEGGGNNEIVLSSDDSDEEEVEEKDKEPNYDGDVGVHDELDERSDEEYGENQYYEEEQLDQEDEARESDDDTEEEDDGEDHDEAAPDEAGEVVVVDQGSRDGDVSESGSAINQDQDGGVDSGTEDHIDSPQPTAAAAVDVGDDDLGEATASMDEGGSQTGYEPEDTHGYTEEEVSEAFHTEDEEEERAQVVKAEESAANESSESNDAAAEPAKHRPSMDSHTLSDMDAADEHTTEHEEDLGAESSELDEGDGNHVGPRDVAASPAVDAAGAGSTLMDFARRAQQQNLQDSPPGSPEPENFGSAAPWQWPKGESKQEQFGEENANLQNGEVSAAGDTGAAHLAASSVSFLDEKSEEGSEVEMEASSPVKVVVEGLPEKMQPSETSQQNVEEASTGDQSKATSTGNPKPPGMQQQSVLGTSLADTNAAHLGSVSFVNSVDGIDEEVDEKSADENVVVDFDPEKIGDIPSAKAEGKTPDRGDQAPTEEKDQGVGSTEDRKETTGEAAHGGALNVEAAEPPNEMDESNMADTNEESPGAESNDMEEHKNITASDVAGAATVGTPTAEMSRGEPESEPTNDVTDQVDQQEREQGEADETEVFHDATEASSTNDQTKEMGEVDQGALQDDEAFHDAADSSDNESSSPVKVDADARQSSEQEEIVSESRTKTADDEKVATPSSHKGVVDVDATESTLNPATEIEQEPNDHNAEKVEDEKEAEGENVADEAATSPAEIVEAQEGQEDASKQDGTPARGAEDAPPSPMRRKRFGKDQSDPVSDLDMGHANSESEDEDTDTEQPARRRSPRRTGRRKMANISETKRADSDVDTDEEKSETRIVSRGTKARRTHAASEVQEDTVSSKPTRRSTRAAKGKKAVEDSGEASEEESKQASVVKSPSSRQPRTRRGRGKAAGTTNTTATTRRTTRTTAHEAADESEDEASTISKSTRQSTRRTRARAVSAAVEDDASKGTRTSTRRVTRQAAKKDKAVDEEIKETEEQSLASSRPRRGRAKKNDNDGDEEAKEEENVSTPAVRSQRKRGRAKRSDDTHDEDEDDKDAASPKVARRSGRSRSKKANEDEPEEVSEQEESSKTSPKPIRRKRGQPKKSDKANDDEDEEKEEESVASSKPTGRKRGRVKKAAEPQEEDDTVESPKKRTRRGAKAKADDSIVEAQEDGSVASRRSTRGRAKKNDPGETAETPSRTTRRATRRGSNQTDTDEPPSTGKKRVTRSAQKATAKSDSESEADDDASKASSKSGTRKRRKATKASDPVDLAPIPEESTLDSPQAEEGQKKATPKKRGRRAAAKKATKDEADDVDDDSKASSARGKGAKKRTTRAKKAAETTDEEDSVAESAASSVRRSSRRNKGQKKHY